MPLGQLRAADRVAGISCSPAASRRSKRTGYAFPKVANELVHPFRKSLLGRGVLFETQVDRMKALLGQPRPKRSHAAAGSERGERAAVPGPAHGGLQRQPIPVPSSFRQDLSRGRRARVLSPSRWLPAFYTGVVRSDSDTVPALHARAPRLGAADGEEICPSHSIAQSAAVTSLRRPFRSHRTMYFRKRMIHRAHPFPALAPPMFVLDNY